MNDTKYFSPVFLTRTPPPTITSFKPASPNLFSRTPRKTRRMKATYSKVNEISQARELFCLDDLHSFRVYGVIQDKIGRRQIRRLSQSPS